MESLSKTAKYKSFTERRENKNTNKLLILQKKIKDQKKSNIILLNNKKCFNKSNDFFQTSLSKNSPSLNSCEVFSKKKIKKKVLNLPPQKEKTFNFKPTKSARELVPKINLASFPILQSKKAVKNIYPKEYDFLNPISSRQFLKTRYFPIYKRQKIKNSIQADGGFREIDITYGKNCPLIVREKFDEKFRILQDVFEVERFDRPYIQKREKIKTKKENQKLLEIKMKKMAQEKKEKEEIRKTKIFKKFKEKIIKAYLHFKRLNIKITHFYDVFQMNQPKIKIEEEDKKKIYDAIKQNDVKSVTKMLIDNSDLVDITDNFGQTPLHLASKRNRYEIIPLLIYKGAKKNVQDFVGQTPLHLASLHNCLEAVQILLYSFADPSILTKNLKTPLDLSSNPVIQYILRRGYIVSIFILNVSLVKCCKSNWKNDKFGKYY